MNFEPLLTDYLPSLRTKQEDGVGKIWDLVRKKWLIIQPEEMVRQLVIHHLITNANYPLSRFASEKGIKGAKTVQRYDILIYDRLIKPFMIIECKAFDIQINESSAHQLFVYNKTLDAPYACITNGRDYYCFKKAEISYTMMDTFPIFPPDKII